MKTLKSLQRIACVTSAIFLASCSSSDDSTPSTVNTSSSLNAKTISQIKGMYTSGLVDFSKANNGQSVSVSGYVVSTDEFGNFYNRLIIQDQPENPTAGLRIDIAIDSTKKIHQNYEVGKKVIVKLYDKNQPQLNALGMQKYDGGYRIGQIKNDSILTKIGDSIYKQHISATAEQAAVVPKVLKPSEFKDNHINTLVALDNTQFTDAELGLTYGEPTSDKYPSNRTLVSCNDNKSETILRTSGSATFKNTTVPSKNGKIVGVLGKYKEDYQLVIRNTTDVNFTAARCGGAVFEENFSAAEHNTNLDLAGWINYAQAGNDPEKSLWRERIYQGNGYAQFAPYQSSDSSNVAWLITPGINMNAQSGEVLTFTTASRDTYFDAGHTPLEVFVSTNFNGSTSGISSATWTKLNPTLTTKATAGTYEEISSGDINLSSYSGTLYIAFKYSGGGETEDTPIQLDNIKITAN